eukprot:CAMPEP_0176484286 /NCGR_PEP_ID=MMETSP0200_2-20121128/4372_1 /TAXON_ID=947934 /ORGANISM="Chaetoceros sp., Strain GSL56" /LENGTH=1594 /DNA_ID=CAMNT_0017880747 /DNA_START=2820 /DNA_END=7604 /DNA_ORIENTATION=-
MIDDIEMFKRRKQQLTDFLLKLANEFFKVWTKFHSLQQSTCAKIRLEDPLRPITKHVQSCIDGEILSPKMRMVISEIKNILHSDGSAVDLSSWHRRVFAGFYLLQLLTSNMISGITSLEYQKDGFCKEEKNTFQELKDQAEDIVRKKDALKDKILLLEKAQFSETGVSETKGEGALIQTKEKTQVVKHGAGKVNIGKRRKRSVETSKTRKQTKKSKMSSSLPQMSFHVVKSNHGPDATIIDRKSDRLVNPLLELPQGSMSSDSMLPVSEYLKLMEIYFPEPDTYPLSFYARLLGIDHTADNDKQISGETEKTIADEWMAIPSLGNFARVFDRLCNSTLESVDADVSKVIKCFDFVDPTWIAILQMYRGYNDAYFKQATELNVSCNLSVECVELARHLNIIDPKVSFKVATVDDFPRLSNFVKNELQLDFSILESNIKAGNHFIVLAVYDEDDIIGFIHYQFCWFQPRSRHFSSIDDAALEHVAHIDSCHTKQIHGLKTEVLTVVLFSLALEHVRFHAGYGMMKLQSSIAPVLKTYFRMSEVSRNVSDSDVCLACDLEKCSFKFALYKLNVKQEPFTDRSMRFRMLVQMPSYRAVSDAQSSIKYKTIGKRDYGIVGDKLGQSNMEKHTERDKEASTKTSLPQAKVFSSSKQKLRNKIVCIRIENGEVKAKRTVRSPHKSNKKAFQGFVDKHDWNILSCFDKTYSVKKNSQYDSVLSELRKQQEKLEYLEEKSRVALQNIFGEVMKERYDFELGETKKAKEIENDVLASYNMYVQRCIESQKAIEAKLEEDENAVCDICGDGESSGENRIIFCDSCDISVHQHCYGVDTVPHGDYFCRACEYYKKHNVSPSPLEEGLKSKTKAPFSVKCELCPKTHGAFVQTQVIDNPRQKEPTEAKWVHFLCAKWQGLKILENVAEGGGYELMVENVQPIKDHFRIVETRCYLCEGMRGSYNKCRHDGCNRWMHVTCARASGICEVIHGDDHIGPVDSPHIWTLCCPEHSKFDEDYIPPSNKVPLDELVALAKTFPIEPKPAPPPEPPKPFHRMTGKERKQKLKNSALENEVCQTLINNQAGARCEICDLTDIKIMSCASCSAVAHVDCCGLNTWETVLNNGIQTSTCTSCIYERNEKTCENYEPPLCHMCQSQTGTLIPCSAKPMSKKWKKNTKQFKKSYFVRKTWCHPICGMWHPKTIYEKDGVVNCTNVIMSDGLGHIERTQACGLCGIKTGLKIQCKHYSKRKKVQCPDRFHATCARNAGFEISNDNPEVDMAFMCYRHSRCDYAFRALLEDMIEFEKLRSGNDLSRSAKPMTLECASKIFSAGVRVMRCLGWAWQWSKWWVCYGDSWEPLLEVGQIEANMTKEQLKIVDSTVTSRRADARKCRLAAFGAALRNRDYDREPGDDRKTLHNALRGILSTPSLVGPLSDVEIEFFVEWLGRVYRSKTVLLGFGPDKLPVNENWESSSAVHFKDKTPKYELGNRTLPGKHVRNGYLFENGIKEIDDFSDDEDSPSSISTPRKKGTAIEINSNTSGNFKPPLTNSSDEVLTSEHKSLNQRKDTITAKSSETFEPESDEKEGKSHRSNQKPSLDDPIPRKKRSSRD